MSGIGRHMKVPRARLENSNQKPQPSRNEGWDVAKERNCLNCNTSFMSLWSGERVCVRCKSKNTWRNASAQTTSRPAPSRSTPSSRG